MPHNFFNQLSLTKSSMQLHINLVATYRSSKEDYSMFDSSLIWILKRMRRTQKFADNSANKDFTSIRLSDDVRFLLTYNKFKWMPHSVAWCILKYPPCQLIFNSIIGFPLSICSCLKCEWTSDWAIKRYSLCNKAKSLSASLTFCHIVNHYHVQTMDMAVDVNCWRDNCT